jgi:hypothetical protein
LLLLCELSQALVVPLRFLLQLAFLLLEPGQFLLLARQLSLTLLELSCQVFYLCIIVRCGCHELLALLELLPRLFELLAFCVGGPLSPF